MSTENKFKAGNGNWLTRGLFFETTMDKASILYTLKNEPHYDYPSLYQSYIQSPDPTEYLFANTFLGGWQHWEELCTCVWFKEYLSQWRREAEIKLRAQALSQLLAAASAQSRDSLAINKWLVEGGWKVKGTSKRGAPSKEEIQSAAHNLALIDQQLTSDLERLKN